MANQSFIEALKRLHEIESESHHIEQELLALSDSHSQYQNVFSADFVMMAQTTIESLIPMRQMMSQMMKQQLGQLEKKAEFVNAPPSVPLSADPLSSSQDPHSFESAPPLVEVESRPPNLTMMNLPDDMNQVDQLSEEEIKALGLDAPQNSREDHPFEDMQTLPPNNEDPSNSRSHTPSSTSHESSNLNHPFELDETPFHEYTPSNQDGDHTQIGLPYQERELANQPYSPHLIRGGASQVISSNAITPASGIQADLNFKSPTNPDQSNPDLHALSAQNSSNPQEEWDIDLFAMSAGEAGTMVGIDPNNPIFHRPAPLETVAPPIPPQVEDPSKDDESRSLWNDLNTLQDPSPLSLSSTPHPLDPIDSRSQPPKSPHINRETRSAFSVPVYIETPYLKVRGQSENLNIGGLFIKTDAQLQVGEEVRLEFEIPNTSAEENLTDTHSISCTALVRWINATGVGVNFLGLRRSDKSQIQSYLSLSTKN